MKKVQENINKFQMKIAVCLAVAIAFFQSKMAYAALPTAVDPTTGASGGNFVIWLQGWFGDSAETMALMVSTSVFLWCAWIIASKFNETRSSNEPDWGSFGLTAIVAGVVMVACTFILTEAVAVI
jgi:integrating conjugative element membrane protein (TIGR03745 family)